jgi:hypothetical protein
MRVFVTAVGTRDPVWKRDSDGSSRFFAQLRPAERQVAEDGPALAFFRLARMVPMSGDQVYILSTAKGPNVKAPTEKGGEALRRALAARYPRLGLRNVRHLRLRRLDPSEFADVLPAFDDALSLIRDETGRQPAELIVNASPGTPQMRAAWYTLWHSGRLRGRLVEVKEGAGKQPPRVQEVDLAPLALGDQVRVGLRLFSAFAFPQAAEVFADTFAYASGLPTSAVAELCRGLGEWSAGQFVEAREALAASLPGLDGVRFRRRETTIRVRALVRLLDKGLVSPGHGLERLVDLHQRARCEHAAGHPLESTWRSHAVCEMALSMKVLDIVASRTGLPAPAADLRSWAKVHAHEPTARALLAEAGIRVEEDRLPAEADLARRLLRTLEPEAERLFGSRWLSAVRAAAVHQAQTPGPRDAERALDEARGAIVAVFGHKAVARAEARSLSRETLARLATLLAGALECS